MKTDHLLITEALLSLEQTIGAELFVEVTYPWQALPLIGDFIKTLGNQLDTSRYSKVGEDIWIAKSATIYPSAHIAGPTIIDEEAEIRHNAFIRGNVLVGKGAIVGNATELKNAILFNQVQVPHYNYIGDSILGYKAHLGAGAITSNVRADKQLVTVRAATEAIETGLKKFGAIIADEVEIGCNSVLNPGTVIGKQGVVYPLSSVRGVVPATSIYKNDGEIVEKL